ncbi:helix-turn-helix transcriptional regulator [Trueperella pyogenes]|uniref:helix-turn-helix domain-containing protein n=1 Tax=Trueperella pyogenes TaxID=1661 RepID=UPI000E0D3EBF|nr:helix-turn-helix transcriptional regulator [Trueperella pyogenes]
MDSHLKFGKFIETKRKAAQLTMRAFADKADMTAPYLSDIEKGRRAAPDSKLETIATALALTPAEREEMYDLAALTRDDQTPTDLTEYIRETDNARVALRRAKERNYSDHDWQKIIDIIEGDGVSR